MHYLLLLWTVVPVEIPIRQGETPACVSLPADERMLVYQSSHPSSAGKLDLWISRKVDGRWSAPENAGPGVNTADYEADGKFSADGRTLVLIRGADLKKNTDIYISELRNGQWSEAKLAGPPVSLPDTLEFGALLTHNGNRLYFSSNRAGGHGGFDLYYSDKTPAGWGEPVNLGSEINTEADELDLAITADERVIVLPMKGDLFVSHRRAKGWSAPVKLGEAVNTPAPDSCPWIGFSSRILFFNSTRDGRKGIWATRTF